MATVPISPTDMSKMPAAVQSQASDTNYVEPSTDNDVMTGKTETQDATDAANYGPRGTTVAYVPKGSSDTVKIPDPSVLSETGPNGKAATLAHETVHVMENNRPPTEVANIPADDASKPYDISDVDDLRKQGKTFADLPQEKAATIVQKYIESGGKATNLKPWIGDIKNLHQSTIQPTTDKNAPNTLNTTARAPRGGQSQLEELSENDVHNPPPKAATKSAPQNSVAKGKNPWYAGASGLAGKK